MKKIICYPLKFYLLKIVLIVSALMLTGLMLFVLSLEFSYGPVVISILSFSFAVTIFIVLIQDIQRVTIDNDVISACNVFGVIKCIDRAKIRSFKIVEAPGFIMKDIYPYRTCILISTHKSVVSREIKDAYNHKKNTYIILPYTQDNYKTVNMWINNVTEDLYGKISFEQISKVFTFNIENQYCIEMCFSLDGNKKYTNCWMGKCPNREDKQKDVYWFGLVADGSESYNYDSFQELSIAPVFDGRSLIEVWDNVAVESLDGCDPIERLQFYQDENHEGFYVTILD